MMLHLPRLFLVIAFLSLLAASTVVAADSAVGPLMKLFQSGRLPVERQPAVVEMICKRGNADDLAVVFGKVLEPQGFTPELRLNALTWLTDAAVTRKILPSGELGGLADLVVGEHATAHPELQQRSIALASVWKVAAVAPALQQLALNSQTPQELRQVAIAGLVTIGDPGSQKTLADLATADQPLEIRMLATAGMVQFDVDAAAQAGAAILKVATPRTNPGPLLDAFFQQKDGADILAKAVAATPPSGDVAKVALRYMFSVGRSDAALSNALGNAAGIAANPEPPTQMEVAELVVEVEGKGDAVRGEAIFRRADISCMKCHSVSRAGGQIGPDLSAVGGSSPTDYIVNSILNPNLAVKEQYVTKVFELSSGKVLTGVVIDRDEVRVNLRDVTGETITIPTADIEDEIEGKSLMPQGLTKFLTHEELVDLARFVSELGKSGPYGINKALTVQRWRMLASPPKELTQDVPHLEHVRQFLVGSEPKAWTPVYSRVGGTLPLSELRGENGPTVVILKGEIDVRTAGDVAVKITSSVPVHSWVDAEAFETQTQYSVPLTAGRHAVYLRVPVTPEGNPELKVEFSAPETSSAKFEVVGGA